LQPKVEGHMTQIWVNPLFVDLCFKRKVHWQWRC